MAQPIDNHRFKLLVQVLKNRSEGQSNLPFDNKGFNPFKQPQKPTKKKKRKKKNGN